MRILADSILPVRMSWVNEEKALESQLVEIESGYLQTGDHKIALTKLLKMVGPEAAVWTRRVRFRLFNDLARVSARLRLYPMAMRCYYNAGKQLADLPQDSSLYQALPLCESPSTTIDSIRAAFDDGKEATDYAMLVEVKQPSPGRRKAFSHLSNVGHTFITLIKYNKDSSVNCRSFGFYPHKAHPLDATPLHPSSPAVIRDDSRHDWDEIAGKFISGKQFYKVLATLQSYEHRQYNLNHSNCTDFGLTMARLGGISIQRTSGRWPLGKGNNPGSAGQSMLEGKVSNIDIELPVPLFLATNNIASKDEPLR